MPTLKRLSLWYVSPLRRCNFSCAYCASGQPFVTDRNEWQANGEVIHNQVLRWITQLPHRIRLRVNSIGEPFVSRTYTNSIAKLSHSENLDFVEVLTNGSYTKENFLEFAAASSKSKLRLWMTFHPSHMKLERFIESALIAQNNNVSVIVHGLIFPDTLADVHQLVEACKANNLKFHVGIGLNYNNAYPNKGFTPTADDPAAVALSKLSVVFPVEVHELSKAPQGAKCAAGSDYFYINPIGDVFPCRTYANHLPQKKLGSVLDPNFELQPRESRYSSCESMVYCECLEDHQNLKKAQDVFVPDNESFVLWSKENLRAGPVDCA